ncbi:uncharacterized protein N7525_011220 [Penicillium rubens]|jgi:hypothetical protein|uniref:uncharacterized protein n=1 Tax=Penicillium rubens TaxID=1108849 RepID=UPI002A5AFBD0|nr:uncharacterized protein N7525_011220 [Penicillium rubens]KAJ5821936.1 hypothetical protein N7525_011220 [Penicillium rubens]KAJ5859577.1 hypothetical protein N7534_004854 [Penicillium rubens]
MVSDTITASIIQGGAGIVAAALTVIGTYIIQRQGQTQAATQPAPSFVWNFNFWQRSSPRAKPHRDPDPELGLGVNDVPMIDVAE